MQRVDAFGNKKLLALALTALLIFPFIASQRAFADGLTMENLPPATFGNRQAALFVKINPPILTTLTKQDAYLQFRLFDVNNNQTIKFPTLNIAVYKGTDPKAPALLQDFFQSQNGLLTLKIQQSNGAVQIFGNRDGFLSAVQADPGGDVKITGPVLSDGGLYRIDVGVFGIDYPTNIFADKDIKKFQTFLSVGDVSTHPVQDSGKSYNATIISYYDKIKDFKFNDNTKTFSWAMPFDWDIKRINSVANVFVHEEIKIPKSFAGIGDASSFNAKVNGKPIAGRMLAIDPFSDENNLILHFLINKNDILNMARSINSNSAPAAGNNSNTTTTTQTSSPSGESSVRSIADTTTTSNTTASNNASQEMTFSFSPASSSGANSGGTSGEISTDTGGIHVLLGWTPSQLKAGTPASLHLQFVDAFAGSNISDSVKYDIRILDNSGKEVYSKTDQVAKAGSADLTGLNFPSDANYRVEISVKAIMKQGQATPDLTRNGVARGMVVVPEFPAGAMIAVAGSLAAIVVVQRLMRKRTI